MIKQTYFLGGTSPEGFKSKFIEQIKKTGYYTYILKGGPGTGKSTFMKKVAKAFEDMTLELYYCSSDTRSLDAVVIEEKKIIIVDGTAPHVFEALYPGASQEVINLGEFWDGNKLKKHEKAIHYLFDENLKYHDRVRCCIKAVAALNDDIRVIGEDSIDRKKLDGYIGRFQKRLALKKKGDIPGNVEFKQLSAFTTDNYSTCKLLTEGGVYIVKDDLFAGSDYFLKKIACYLTSLGYNVCVSECTINNEALYEHLVCDEIDMSFMTSNFVNKLDIENASVINLGRFYDKEKLFAKKHRIAFDKKASGEIAKEASEALTLALAVHDELEKNYIDAIDFKKLSKFTNDFIQSLSL